MKKMSVEKAGFVGLVTSTIFLVTLCYYNAGLSLSPDQVAIAAGVIAALANLWVLYALVQGRSSVSKKKGGKK